MAATLEKNLGVPHPAAPTCPSPWGCEFGCRAGSGQFRRSGAGRRWVASLAVARRAAPLYRRPRLGATSLVVRPPPQRGLPRVLERPWVAGASARRSQALPPLRGGPGGRGSFDDSGVAATAANIRSSAAGAFAPLPFAGYRRLRDMPLAGQACRRVSLRVGPLRGTSDIKQR